MVGQCNVYVSVTRATEGELGHGYHKPKRTWMLSVEPHHTHIPGTPRKALEPVHYAVAKNPDGHGYTIRVHDVENEPAIIGNILIAESVHTSPEQVHVFLEQLLGPSSKINSHDEDEVEHWIRTAVRGLQERKVVEGFRVDELMTFARSYEANRMESEAPALVVYPKIHEDHEKKASKYKFWVSHPAEHRTKKNHQGEAMSYGGPM